MENAHAALGVAMIFAIIIIIISIPIYFLPSILAYRKQHANKTGILILNLFLGWTLIGWVGALVWAVTETEDNNKVIEIKKNKYEDLERLQKLKDNGTISEEEFEREKEKILK